MGSAKEDEGTVGRSAAQHAIKEKVALIRSHFIALYRGTALYLLDMQMVQGHVSPDQGTEQSLLSEATSTGEEENRLRANASTGGGSQMCLNKRKKKPTWRKLRGKEPNHI